MPSSSERAVHFYVSRAEERNLIAWARQHERPVSAQIRWHLRDILSGRCPPPQDAPPCPPAPAKVADQVAEANASVS
jgi:hypothetical protein